MDEQNLNWYALYVRSKHEFVMTAQLQRQGVEVFLPYIRRMRRWSDREIDSVPATFRLCAFLSMSRRARRSFSASSSGKGGVLRYTGAGQAGCG